MKLTNEQFDRLRRELQYYAKQNPKIRIGTPLKCKGCDCKCNFSRRLTIRPNGYVTFCEAIKTQDEYKILRNINDSSLKDIVHSDEFDIVRDKIESIKCEHTNCPIQELYYRDNK